MAEEVVEMVVPWREEAVVVNQRKGEVMWEEGEKVSSTGSKLIVNGEVCLEGYDGVGGGEVKGGAVVLGVFKR
ncbi:hypothetical protein Tco_1481652 [Tanacetum coccineum]